jgi:protein SCO1
MTAGGAPTEPRWTLTDHHGRRVTERDFRGWYQLVFFGFTHCRVVCPRALSKLTAVLDDIIELAQRIQPLYISVDPKRDTPDVMRAFLEQNYPHFLGLTGSVEETEVARSAFRVFAGRREDPDDPDGYAVPHSALTYLIDPDGRYVTHFPDVAEADRIAYSLKKLVC